MALVHQSESAVGHPAALRRIAKTLDYFTHIAQVGIKSNVVLIRLQNVVVPPAHQHLAGSCPGRVEMARRDAFRISGAARTPGKETGLELVETNRILIYRLMPHRQPLQQGFEPL